MNREIDLNIDKLKQDLLKEACVQEYLRLKELIINDENIEDINKQMKYLKKCKMSNEELLQYDELKRKLDENPAIKNFKEVEKEVLILFNEIKEELEK